MINAEVRLYYIGRSDWDTEFFTATDGTDVQSKATAIATERKADHFNFGVATVEDEYKHSGPIRRPKLNAAPKDIKEQIKIIEEVTGVSPGTSSDY